MAKNTYTRTDIVDFIKALDTRAKAFDDTKLDFVINRAYTEMTNSAPTLFSDENILNLAQYYDLGQDLITLDVSEDCLEVYDTYTTLENTSSADLSICDEVVNGIGIYRNRDTIYRDNRNVGRVYVDLKAIDYQFDNAVIKFYYVPKATTAEVYMSARVYAAFQDAIGVAVNYFLKDVEGEMQKQASLRRTSLSANYEPEDIPDRTPQVFKGMR